MTTNVSALSGARQQGPPANISGAEPAASATGPHWVPTVPGPGSPAPTAPPQAPPLGRLQAEGEHILTEPGDVKLVRGESRCAGELDVKHLGEWRPVRGDYSLWTLKAADFFCRHLDCGSAVSVGWKEESSVRPKWLIRSECIESGSALRECAIPDASFLNLNIICSDSVRLLGGTGLCSGRLEVKSDQSWSSVCEADFDQQDAQVVCKQLGCGAPSVLQGALYGEGEAPMWTKEFQCGGHESALLDCSSASERNTCSPGTAVSLTCSEPGVKLVGGESRCAGRLEVNYRGEWRTGDGIFSPWNLKAAAVACRDLDCGSAVSVRREESSQRYVWGISPDCLLSGSPLRECATSYSSNYILNLTCSGKPISDIISDVICDQDSVRLLGGTGLCSGRLEVKSDQSWSSVCEADFDQQDGQVVCRQLGCGAPSVLQRALYGEGEAPMWTKEFQCGGNESALLDCSSASERNTCSSGRAVSLTCSEPGVKLVGGESRCAGTLEVKHRGEWRPVEGYDSLWTLKAADPVCRDLDCGSAVSVGQREESSKRSLWRISPDCVQSGSALRECAISVSSPYFLNLTCSAVSTLVVLQSDPEPFIIRAIVLPLTLLVVTVGLYFYCKATRRPSRQEDIELDYLGVPAEEEGAQAAE
ncbi:hypothetical protein NQZ68_020086 [Dissostichus eleginoides]|nr:hypothetical protein NQZ68_020086 [Dissostichus eleginoides]